MINSPSLWSQSAPLGWGADRGSCRPPPQCWKSGPNCPGHPQHNGGQKGSPTITILQNIKYFRSCFTSHKPQLTPSKENRLTSHTSSSNKLRDSCRVLWPRHVGSLKRSRKPSPMRISLRVSRRSKKASELSPEDQEYQRDNRPQATSGTSHV